MEPLARVLTSRRSSQGPSLPRHALVTSSLLHVVLVLGLFVGPGLLADKPARLEYVPVAVMQPADLERGRKPTPKVPEPKKEKEPEPKPPEPEPEKVETLPEDVPVLPAKEPKPKPKEPKPSPPTPKKEPPKQETSSTSSQPKLPAGSTGASKDSPAVSFDDRDFKFTYYTDRMVQAIQRHWNRPPIDRPIETLIAFRIQADGRVSELRILDPSGLRSWDNAALRAVEDASPLPHLPRGYRKPSLGVTLVVRNRR